MNDHEQHDEQPIGDALDNLGITTSLPDGALISNAVVVLKILLPSGATRLAIAYSEGLDWIDRAGLLHVAHAMETDRATALRRPDQT